MSVVALCVIVGLVLLALTRMNQLNPFAGIVAVLLRELPIKCAASRLLGMTYEEAGRHCARHVTKGPFALPRPWRALSRSSFGAPEAVCSARVKQIRQR